jgi:cell division protease FtsH
MAQPEIESRLRASERMVLGSVSTGAANDLKEATQLASHMVAHYGISETLGPVYYDHEEEHPLLGQRMGTGGGTSPTTIAVIEEEGR